MLMAGRIAGLREHRGAIVAEADWPAIVDREVWEAARAVLAGRTRRGRPSTDLLTGEKTRD
jgi:hypothetical protein